MSVTPFAPQLPPVAPTGQAVSTGPGAGDPAAAGFAALVAGLLAGNVVPPVAAVLTPPEAPTAEEGTATDEVPEQDGDTVDEVAVAPVPVLGVPPYPVLAALVHPGQGALGATAQGPTDPVQPDPVETDPVAVVPEATTPVAAGPQPAETAAPANPGPDPGPTASPVTAVAPTSAPATTAAPTVTETHPVTRQVIPEVTRLVSQGNGTHRLTMTLRPEALGEVRVTLTVRDGEVRVRFAAGEEAQRALVEGAPELRRVLELAGAGDTRVVVRDLAQPVTPGTTSPTTPSPAHSGGEGRGDTAAAGHGRSTPQDQHAGTRGGSNARDGLSDGAHAPRPEPDRHTRTAGVDLTM